MHTKDTLILKQTKDNSAEVIATAIVGTIHAHFPCDNLHCLMQSYQAKYRSGTSRGYDDGNGMWA